MILSNVRASAYRIAAAVLGVSAVALLVACLFFRDRAFRANVRADAESARAEALQTELDAARAAIVRDDRSAEATNAARAAAHARRQEQAELAERVKGYADAAGDVCAADDDLLRESQEAASRIRAAEGRLRGDGRTDGNNPD